MKFGIRLNFLPTLTPHGTIRLQVAPEVNSPDYTDAVTFQGFTLPTITTRRVLTEVELESGQSFVIGGLLDNATAENLKRSPGLANIPLWGKLFQSKSLIKSDSELLVIITLEFVRPIAAAQPVPLRYPTPRRILDSPLPPSSPAVPLPGSSPNGKG